MAIVVILLMPIYSIGVYYWFFFMTIGYYFINVYSWLLMAILLMVIGYTFGDYWLLFYWCLLMAILLIIIGDFFLLIIGCYFISVY